MCNPRRVTITATRELAEHWERALERQVRLHGEAVGEVRVREQLGDSQAANVLAALGTLLERGRQGWRRDGAAWRHELEGGYLHYQPDQGTLEIVAVATRAVEAEGRAQRRLSGQAQGEISAQGEGGYYDDHYGGRTEEHARADAQAQAEANLARLAQTRRAQAAAEAERAAEPELLAEAQAAGEANLARQREALRAELETEARQRLSAVGLRARQLVNGLLADAYREVILAYAASRGATVVHDHNDDHTLELELRL